MNFNNYSHLEGTHAFLSPSNYHWVNYSLDKLDVRYTRRQAAARGSKLHALAEDCIKLGVPLPDDEKTLNMYVNDALYYEMDSEVMLYYSDNCYGTVDAITFDDYLLRIHDLKTGVTRASMKQLEVYTAIFCLEYDVNPNDIEIELRIYQNDEVVVHEPEKETIFRIMEKIITFDKRIEEIKMEV